MDIKKIVERLTGKHRSRDPFTIARNLGIILLYPDTTETLGFFSCYKRSRFIHISNNAPRKLRNFICGHELAHALFHPYENTPFLKTKTLLSTDRIEREANTFAVELLLPDELLREYPDHSIYAIAAKQGVPEKLIRLKNFTR
ncbi:MAG: ImmA/IrrE family metallo-endopeptidase [Sporomusaceae bacterium]|nr:ImmA/IrrE family metallo-endopeptidase [Sporomusaceae bacterium]